MEPRSAGFRVKLIAVAISLAIIGALAAILCLFSGSPSPREESEAVTEADGSAEAEAPSAAGPEDRSKVKAPVRVAGGPKRPEIVYPERNLKMKSPPGRKAIVPPAPPPPPPPPPTLESKWGIEIASMRLSMLGSAVDMRYKVIDPVKAALLGDGKTAAYIIERSTGKKLLMPTPPKEMAFPPTSNKLIAGRIYNSVVSNQGGTLKSGSQVTVVVGNVEIADLTVE